MNPLNTSPIGTETDSGYYGGRVLIDAQPFALILPPKAQADHADKIYIENYEKVPGAQSFNDGYANTIAMAKASSQVAQQALDLGMYIPAQDELEVLYRNLKPGVEKNWCYARSGINLNAIPPTSPHTPDFPSQTELSPFKTGGVEAFEEALYWTSTQYVSVSVYAWCQGFASGDQYCGTTSARLRVRFVRRLSL